MTRFWLAASFLALVGFVGCADTAQDKKANEIRTGTQNAADATRDQGDVEAARVRESAGKDAFGNAKSDTAEAVADKKENDAERTADAIEEKGENVADKVESSDGELGSSLTDPGTTVTDPPANP